MFGVLLSPCTVTRTASNVRPELRPSLFRLMVEYALALPNPPASGYETNTATTVLVFSMSSSLWNPLNENNRRFLSLLTGHRGFRYEDTTVKSHVSSQGQAKTPSHCFIPKASRMILAPKIFDSCVSHIILFHIIPAFFLAFVRVLFVSIVSKNIPSNNPFQPTHGRTRNETTLAWLQNFPDVGLQVPASRRCIARDPGPYPKNGTAREAAYASNQHVPTARLPFEPRLGAMSRWALGWTSTREGICSWLFRPCFVILMKDEAQRIL